MVKTTPPVLFVIAGPNGAGKTTLYEYVLRPKINAPFINADYIQKNELQDQTMQGSYAAAKIAAKRRQEYITLGKSFVAETVFSHKSKNQMIEDAIAAGFIIILFHVGLESPALAIVRVAKRVQGGGHNVPEEKIRARYARNKKYIHKAAIKVDTAYIFDNSVAGQAPRLQLKFKNGYIVKAASEISTWCGMIYRAEINKFRAI